MAIDSEWVCTIIMIVSCAMIVIGVWGGLASLATGYSMNQIAESEDVSPIKVEEQDPNDPVYYHNYSDLSEAQQDEFEKLQAEDKVRNLSALSELGAFPIHIQHNGDKYIVETGVLFSVERLKPAVVGLVLFISGILGVVYGYERRVEIRLERLYENPEAALDAYEETE